MQDEVKVSQEDLGWATSAAQHLCSTQDRDAAIRLLAQAFARHRQQAERGEAEPVAYLYTRDDGSKDLVLDCNGEYARNLIKHGATEVPLYALTTPPEAV